MANKFVRNITDTEVTGKNKEPLQSNVQNDLLSDGDHVYVRNQNRYDRITGSVEGGQDGKPPKITLRLDDDGNLFYKVTY